MPSKPPRGAVNANRHSLVSPQITLDDPRSDNAMTNYGRCREELSFDLKMYGSARRLCRWLAQDTPSLLETERTVFRFTLTQWITV
jgi:hypothetical protein